jgi:type IV pilus assembly protein PilV
MNKKHKGVKDHLNHPMKGFTLIEVLVSVVVFSIGLIGLASLQTISLKHNNTSYMRSQAILLAQDIADRMRANSLAVTAGNYNMGNDLKLTNDPGFKCTIGSFPGGKTDCDFQDLAQADLYYWAKGNDADTENRSVEKTLPGGQGIVCIDNMDDGATKATPNVRQCDGASGVGGANNVYAIKIWWDEDRNGAIDSDDPVFITSFRP